MGPTPRCKKYLDQRDDLRARRTPRPSGGGPTAADPANRFLTSRKRQLNGGEITNLTFLDYHRVCDRIVRVFHRARPVDDLAADDFERLKADIAKTSSLATVGNEINRVRAVFHCGFATGLIDKPIRFGPTFKRPTKRVVRREQQKNGASRMFEADQIRTMLKSANPQLRAMILLGANGGLDSA